MWLSLGDWLHVWCGQIDGCGIEVNEFGKGKLCIEVPT